MSNIALCICHGKEITKVVDSCVYSFDFSTQKSYQIGKAFHISIDLALVSTCLAGIKRNTGLTLKLENIENEQARIYTTKYLNIGESFYDNAVAACGSSKYFVRK